MSDSNEKERKEGGRKREGGREGGKEGRGKIKGRKDRKRHRQGGGYSCEVTREIEIIPFKKFSELQDTNTKKLNEIWATTQK